MFPSVIPQAKLTISCNLGRTKVENGRFELFGVFILGSAWRGGLVLEILGVEAWLTIFGVSAVRAMMRQSKFIILYVCIYMDVY